jgi:hypothetical protein
MATELKASTSILVPYDAHHRIFELDDLVNEYVERAHDRFVEFGEHDGCITEVRDQLLKFTAKDNIWLRLSVNDYFLIVNMLEIPEFMQPQIFSRVVEVAPLCYPGFQVLTRSFDDVLRCYEIFPNLHRFAFDYLIVEPRLDDWSVEHRMGLRKLWPQLRHLRMTEAAVPAACILLGALPQLISFVHDGKYRDEEYHDDTERAVEQQRRMTQAVIAHKGLRRVRLPRLGVNDLPSDTSLQIVEAAFEEMEPLYDDYEGRADEAAYQASSDRTWNMIGRVVRSMPNIRLLGPKNIKWDTRRALVQVSRWHVQQPTFLGVINVAAPANPSLDTAMASNYVFSIGNALRENNVMTQRYLGPLLVLASIRANSSHGFRDSILTMAPAILSFIGDDESFCHLAADISDTNESKEEWRGYAKQIQDIKKETTHAYLSRFLETRYARAVVSDERMEKDVVCTLKRKAE